MPNSLAQLLFLDPITECTSNMRREFVVTVLGYRNGNGD